MVLVLVVLVCSSISNSSSSNCSKISSNNSSNIRISSSCNISNNYNSISSSCSTRVIVGAAVVSRQQ